MEFITAADTAGYLAYQRSAVFLMMKAFQDVVGKDHLKNLTVCFSVENGLYVEVEGEVTLSQKLLNQAKEEMERLVKLDLPLLKRSENTDEAMDHFQEQGMYDKRVCSITGGRRGSMFTGSAIMTTISTDIWS